MVYPSASNTSCYDAPMDPKRHWENVYQTKSADEVSWFRPHLDASLALIREAAPSRDARIVDVGGGEATLIDDLLAAGYRHVDVLDLSETALNITRDRVGAAGHAAGFLVGDVTSYPFAPGTYDLWHDRAVFHFLTDPDKRAAYVDQVRRAVKPGGHVMVATFGPDGPLKCSGLDVVRYDHASLHGEFGDDFTLLKHDTEEHVTPSGKQQQFVYCLCRR